MGINFQEIEKRQLVAEQVQKQAVASFIEAAKAKPRKTLVDKFLIWLTAKPTT